MAIAHLSDWGVIEVTGADATQLLQSQLTQDVADLTVDRAAMAAYCTAKGRMLGQFVVLRDSDRFLLLTHAGLADALVKRLRMFVLRLKCTLRNASADWHVLGIRGSLATECAASAWVDVFQWPNTGAIPAALSVWQVLTLPVVAAVATAPDPSTSNVVPASPRSADVAPPAPCLGHWVGWPSADGAPRHVVIVPSSVADRVVGSAPTVPAATWLLDDMRCGLPFLEPANVEAFVPQMLNLDVLGGISFSKGCYPGQEIVARSHYLGKMKRRMHLGETSAVITSGADVYSSAHPGEPAGRVVNAAPSSDAGTTVILFEMSTDDLQDATLHAGGADGPSIVLRALPYSLPAPNTPPGRG